MGDGHGEGSIFAFTGNSIILAFGGALEVRNRDSYGRRVNLNGIPVTGPESLAGSTYQNRPCEGEINGNHVASGSKQQVS